MAFPPPDSKPREEVARQLPPAAGQPEPPSPVPSPVPTSPPSPSTEISLYNISGQVLRARNELQDLLNLHNRTMFHASFIVFWCFVFLRTFRRGGWWKRFIVKHA
jgi:hypothetical protein